MDKNCKFPKVNFIGNKEKLCSWIVDNFPKDCNTIFDAFSGGCSVSYESKKRGLTVYSNDILKIKRETHHCICMLMYLNLIITQ